jgi:hypothetical protein
MPSKLEKQGNKWTFRYMENGQQKRKTLDAPDYRQAKIEQATFLSRIGITNTKTDAVTIFQHLKDYMDLSINSDNAKQTIYKGVSSAGR